MQDQKHAIYGDNKAVYIAPSFKAAKFWLDNDLLNDCKPGYIYNIVQITEAEEKQLQEADAKGCIFLYYPSIKKA